MKRTVVDRRKPENAIERVDVELEELRARLAFETEKGRDGDAAWTRILIDDALDRRLAHSRAYPETS